MLGVKLLLLDYCQKSQSFPLQVEILLFGDAFHTIYFFVNLLRIICNILINLDIVKTYKQKALKIQGFSKRGG